MVLHRQATAGCSDGRARGRSRRSTRRSTIVYRPFQLDPTAPPGTTIPVAEAYARKFGGPERAAAIIDHVTSVAAEAGLTFHLDRAQRANTRDAHRLLWYAEQHGEPGAQDDVKERLLAAYFVEGRERRRPRRARRRSPPAPVSTPTTCAGSSPATKASPSSPSRSAFAHDAGITAVPTYVIDNRWSIPGAQDPAVFVQVLTRLAERRAG